MEVVETSTRTDSSSQPEKIDKIVIRSNDRELLKKTWSINSKDGLEPWVINEIRADGFAELTIFLKEQYSTVPFIVGFFGVCQSACPADGKPHDSWNSRNQYTARFHEVIAAYYDRIELEVHIGKTRAPQATDERWTSIMISRCPADPSDLCQDIMSDLENCFRTDKVGGYFWWYGGCSIFLGFAAVWYENRSIVCDMVDPTALFTKTNQSVFWTVRLVITYGSLMGIWSSYGWAPALVSFLIYYIFQRVTFRRSYKREYRERYTRYVEALRKRVTADGEIVGEQALKHQASELAHVSILQNMKADSDCAVRYGTDRRPILETRLCCSSYHRKSYQRQGWG